MIKPNELDNNDKLFGCFGKREMEIAAKKIIALAKEAGDWDIQLKAEMFKDNGFEDEGFHDLIEYKWLHRKGNVYYVTDHFVERLKKHKNKEPF